MAYYPTTIKTFEVRVADERIYAEHVNDLQDEVTAIEEELGRTPSGSYPSVKARIENIEDTYLALSGGEMTGDVNLGGGYTVRGVNVDSADNTSVTTVAYVASQVDNLTKLSLAQTLLFLGN